MHSYATNSAERRYIPFFLAALAIAGGYSISLLLSGLGIKLPWWTPSADTMTLYGLIYWLFDRWIWRWHALHYIGFVRVPDLNGEWHGEARPTETDGVSRGLVSNTKLKVAIEQTWQSLCITAETHQSRSRSSSASIRTENGGVLEYQYINEPFATAPATMEIHRGTASFVLSSDKLLLRGDYYSGRGRQNVGAIDLRRQK